MDAVASHTSAVKHPIAADAANRDFVDLLASPAPAAAPDAGSLPCAVDGASRWGESDGKYDLPPGGGLGGRISTRSRLTPGKPNLGETSFSDDGDGGRCNQHWCCQCCSCSRPASAAARKDAAARRNLAEQPLTPLSAPATCHSPPLQAKSAHASWIPAASKGLLRHSRCCNCAVSASSDGHGADGDADDGSPILATFALMRHSLDRLRWHNCANRFREAREQAGGLRRAAAAAGCQRVAAVAGRVAAAEGYVPAVAVWELEAHLDAAEALWRSGRCLV